LHTEIGIISGVQWGRKAKILGFLEFSAFAKVHKRRKMHTFPKKAYTVIGMQKEKQRNFGENSPFVTPL